MPNLFQTLVERMTTPLYKPSQQTLDANTKQVTESAPFQQDAALDPNMLLKFLSSQSDPASLAALSAGPALGMARSAGMLGKAVPEVAGALAKVTPELVDAGNEAGHAMSMVGQAMPAAEDALGLEKTLANRLRQVPTSKRLMPQMPGEFTHAGSVLPNPNIKEIAAGGIKNVNMSPFMRMMENAPTGKVNPDLVIGGGALGGGALLAKKLYDSLQGTNLNPFNRVSGVLDKAAGK